MFVLPAGVCINPPAPFLKGEPTGRWPTGCRLFRPKFYVASHRVALRLPLCKGGQGGFNDPLCAKHSQGFNDPPCAMNSQGFRGPALRHEFTGIQRPASRHVLTRIPKPRFALMFLLRKLLHNPLNHHLSISSHIAILNPNHRQTDGLHLSVPFGVPCLCLGCEM